MAGMVSIRDVVHVMLKEHRWGGGGQWVGGRGGAGVVEGAARHDALEGVGGEGGRGVSEPCCACLQVPTTGLIGAPACPATTACPPVCREEVGRLQEYIQGTF